MPASPHAPLRPARTAASDPPPLTINAANLTLRQLEVLVAVVECGGFRASAARLHMTQSAVSQAMSGLERVLEAPLLWRARGRVTPTALGERVLEHARRALAEVHELATLAAEHHGHDVGTLRLGALPSIARAVVAPALDVFAARYPRVSISLWRGSDRELQAWIAEGMVDVGFVGPVLDPPAGAEVIPLAEDPWYAALPVAHPLAARRSARLEALSRVPYVMSDCGCEPAIRALFTAAGVAPEVAHHALGNETLVGMVASGFGWTLLPELALAPGLRDGVVALPLEPAAARVVAAVVPAGQSAHPVTRALVEAVRRHATRAADHVRTAPTAVARQERVAIPASQTLPD